MNIFWYSAGRLLLLLHGLCAMALCGAAVHQAIVALLSLRGRPRPRLSRIYAVTTLCLYCATMALGALCYPRYRVTVRAEYLDRAAPWASNLFDLKENLATLVLPLCVGALVLSRDVRSLGEAPHWIYALCCWGCALIVVGSVIAGLLVTGVHGI